MKEPEGNQFDMVCEDHGRTNHLKHIFTNGKPTAYLVCDECEHPEKYYESNLEKQGIIIGNI